MIKRNSRGQFAKGHETSNTGKTWFKKGCKSWNNGRTPKLDNEGNPNWKGDEATYSAIHWWVYRHLGKAKTCEHCGKTIEQTSIKGIQWANKDHKYKRNLDDWIQLCASCHKKYDSEQGLILCPYCKKLLHLIKSKQPSLLKYL